LVIALFIFAATGLDQTFLGETSAGIVEEIAKVLAAVVLLRGAQQYKWILNGLLIGAAIGAGFAGFESAGYIFRAFYSDLTAQDAGFTQFYGTLFTRALFAPFCHVVWTASVVGALWRVKKDQPFCFSMFFQKDFLRILALVVLLHMLWNSGLLWATPGNAALLKGQFYLWLTSIVGSWYLALLLAQEGLRQVRAANRIQTEPDVLYCGLDEIPGQQENQSISPRSVAKAESSEILRPIVIFIIATASLLFIVGMFAGVIRGPSSKSNNPDTVNENPVKISENSGGGSADHAATLTAPAKFALIPAGGFGMGDALGDLFKSVDTVYVSAFYMEENLVTKAQWDRVFTWAVAHGYKFSTVGAGKAPNHPVQTVCWDDCVKWCNARSEEEGLTPCYTTGTNVWRMGYIDLVVCDWNASGYRLPTEAEWEKAARGGLSGKRFPWGDTISHTQANYNSHSSDSYDVSSTRLHHPTYDDEVEPYTSPVGSFAPNGYGLYDMAGNIWEWCWDCFDGTSPGVLSDPVGPAWREGWMRIVRGGSWDSSAYLCKLSEREGKNPGLSSNDVGFRCVHR
jgi:formylglycine-generating enzyme required for sulfatase activity/RsiW-degrading membrane proteinase PrsW (M82 family)